MNGSIDGLGLTQAETEQFEGEAGKFWGAMNGLIFPGLIGNHPEDKKNHFSLEGYKISVAYTLEMLLSGLKSNGSERKRDAALRLFNKIIPVTKGFVQPLVYNERITLWDTFKKTLRNHQAKPEISNLMENYKISLDINDE